MIVYDELAGECGVTIPTAKQWLSILASTGIITLISPWFPNVLKRIVKAPRLYFLDTGLCAHLLKWPQPETLEAGPQSGAFFETWVVSEIYKSFLNAGKEPPLYYYRDRDKKEIDLLIHDDSLLHPVEIKKTASPDKSMIASFSVLEPLNKVNETDRNSALPFSPSVGTGALICQYPQVLPLDDRNSIVPAALI
jgi:predicted AAA+ superfamily ATPase